MTSKIGLLLVVVLASCSTRKSLFYYNSADSKLKGKIESVDEKGFQAIYTNAGITAGVRKRQFDFEDDVKKFYDSLGRLSYEVYTQSNDSIHLEMTHKYLGSDTIFQYRKYNPSDTFNLYLKIYLKDKHLIT